VTEPNTGLNTLAAQDPRGAQGRPLRRQRPEGLDLHRAGGDKILLLARTTPLEDVQAARRA
jgi:hypothetical protein